MQGWCSPPRSAHDAILAAGFAPGSEFLWDDHYAVHWDLIQRTYSEELDPEWECAAEAGTPFCQSGLPSCDADYDYASRPVSVRAAIDKVANTGRIGKPLLTLHGTLDTLLPISARRAKLGKRCGFSSRVTFRRTLRGRLEFIARFSGNRAVAPGSARTIRVSR